MVMVMRADLPGSASRHASRRHAFGGTEGVKESEKNSSSGSPHCAVKSRCAASTIDRRAAGVDLVAGEIRAGPPSPRGARSRCGRSSRRRAAPRRAPARSAARARVLPALRELVQVEIGAHAAAPVERHRPLDARRAARARSIALIGAKPVPLARSTMGFALVLAQEEGAERPLEAQDVLLLHAR